MYLDIISLIIIFVLALPVSIAFSKTLNGCLQRHATLMFQEEEITHPQIYIPRLILWTTVFIILLFAYVKSVDMIQFAIQSLFLLGMLLITYIDIKYQYIFDEVLLALGALAIISTPYIPYNWLDRLGGVLAGAIIMLLIAFLSKGMLGGGDIKMVAMLGLWQGLAGLYVCVTVGFISAAIFAIIALVSKQKKMGDTMAFAPFLAFGAFIYWLGMYNL